MFDDLIKEFKKLENTTYSMQILADDDGYVDKECHDSKCQKKFKVYSEDWNILTKESIIHCPFCGHKATTSNWFTTEQINQAKQQAIQKIHCDINNALIRGTKATNKKLNRNFNKKSFIKMNFTYNGNASYFIDMPSHALDEMQQKIECPICHFRYEVIGSGFFCPKCGENSAEKTFSNTIEKVKGNIKNLSTIYNAVIEISKDEATRTCESLRVNSLNDLVVAFQRLCESLYTKIKPTEKIKKNLFQRLDDGSKKFKDTIGYGYEDILKSTEFYKLIICFQKRHCFTHNDGIVDEDYINKSGDKSYELNQHLCIKESEIIDYTNIVEKLGKTLIDKTN